MNTFLEERRGTWEISTILLGTLSGKIPATKFQKGVGRTDIERQNRAYGDDKHTSTHEDRDYVGKIWSMFLGNCKMIHTHTMGPAV